MPTVVQIANLALTRIGEPMITDLDEDTKAARLSSLLYEPSRDAVMRAHIWNVATKRTTLAASSTAPNHEWDYAFPLPADFLRLVAVYDHQVDFDLEDGSILTNSSEMKIRYIYRLEDTTKFDPLLTQAIAAKLAIELNNALTRDPNRNTELVREYQMKLSEARFVDAAEGPERTLRTREWVDSRRYGTNDGEPYRRIGTTS